MLRRDPHPSVPKVPDECQAAEADTLGDTLISRYEDFVGYVHRRFSLGEFARDVVHDAYVQVTVRPPCVAVRNPIGLLRRLLHNLAIDSIRRSDVRARHEQALDPALLPQAACPAPGPEATVEGRQELERLIQAIDSLPLRCREVFIMHKIHGLPQVQVATVLHISLQTVEKHLRRGMQTCRHQLGRCGSPGKDTEHGQ